MALDNWFQTWHPPHFPQPLYEPIKNYSTAGYHETHSVKKNSTPNKLLPIFLSLNLLRPQFPRPIPSKRGKHEPPNNELHTFRIPEYPGNVNRDEDFTIPGTLTKEKSYSRKQENAISNLRTSLGLSESPRKEDKRVNKNPYSTFRIPSEHPASINSKESSYNSFYPDSLDFPDPFAEHFKYLPKNGTGTYEEKHHLKPLERTGPFKTWYRWKTLDFKYPSDMERTKAIASGEFVPENNLPLGVEVYKNRIFLSMPKWKPGVPVTLAQLPRVPKEESPQLVPYPSWAWHSEKSCDLITSVFRMYADQCGRLWVLDSGKISMTTEEAKQHCSPKLMIFDLKTDELLEKFVFPDSFIKEDSLYSNIVVDIRDGDCHDAYAYMTDVWRFGLVVFRLVDHKSWRVTDHLFFPDPLAAAYQLHQLKFEWTDGIFGTALSPLDHLNDERILYFHPMSSFREFYVKTSYLRDEDADESRREAFKILGDSRGPSGHVSTSVMDENGIMYYNLVTRDSIGCWDSRKPYKRENLGVVAKSKETLVFPNDIRLDKEQRQSMWIITNRLPYYLIEGLDVTRINFRVMSAYTDESIKGTICDPDIHSQYTYMEYQDAGNCY